MRTKPIVSEEKQEMTSGSSKYRPAASIVSLFPTTGVPLSNDRYRSRSTRRKQFCPIVGHDNHLFVEHQLR